MDRLFKLIIVCFVMLGLTTSPVWSDTTSSGATTNTLSNSTGSNTTITGGYSQVRLVIPQVRLTQPQTTTQT